MAYTSGTASNYKELLAALATFAATNGWTILEQTATRLFLRGAGAGGLDEIHVGLEAYENTSAGYYNWKIAGAWGWRSGRALGSHPMSSPLRYLYLWNTSIPYWMMASPDRVILVAKVGTIYQMLYFGFGIPPATDNQYPYPLIIGACGTSATALYSATGNANSMFWSGNGLNGVICRPGGDWDQVGPSYCLPKSVSSDYVATLVTAVDGSYLLEEIFITDANRIAVYAALDGVYRVSGYSNSAENIVTVSGVNYLVVQDVNRLGIGDFCAVRMA